MPKKARPAKSGSGDSASLDRAIDRELNRLSAQLREAERALGVAQEAVAKNGSELQKVKLDGSSEESIVEAAAALRRSDEFEKVANTAMDQANRFVEMVDETLRGSFGVR